MHMIPVVNIYFKNLLLGDRQIPQDFTYLQNLRNKMNKLIKNRLIVDSLVTDRRDRDWGTERMG